jgi:mono/diheme cytochrome c family protein
LLPESALPAYEKEIDHAGLIRGWNKAALARGRETYQQTCQNCHGDQKTGSGFGVWGRGGMPNGIRPLIFQRQKRNHA